MNEKKLPILGIMALIKFKQKVLIVKRNSKPFKNYWSLPSGGVEYGEKTSQTAVREIKEELLIEVPLGESIGFFENFELNDENEIEFHGVIFVFKYLIDLKQYNVINQLKLPSNEFSSIYWLPREEISNFKLTETTLKIIKKYF